MSVFLKVRVDNEDIPIKADISISMKKRGVSPWCKLAKGIVKGDSPCVLGAATLCGLLVDNGLRPLDSMRLREDGGTLEVTLATESLKK